MAGAERRARARWRDLREFRGGDRLGVLSCSRKSRETAPDGAWTDHRFRLLTKVAINPHVTSARRDAELVNIIDAHPEILGLGIEDEAAIVVNRNMFEVIGTGRVAVYDNVRRNGLWFYWLTSGERFNLATWSR
jgi:cyanophycinase-like exopeptidase